MKITEFNAPEPEPIPEPTLAEELLAEYNDFGKPDVVEEPAPVVVEVDPLEEEIRTQFEASYAGNIGAMEVMQFYKEAPQEYINLLKRLLISNKTKEAWQLIQKVTGTKLQGREFNEDVMQWERDEDQDMVNPLPVVKDDGVYRFIEDVDGKLSELIPNRKNLAGRAYGTALEKIRRKEGTVQEVPMNQIIATEKYLVSDQIKALLQGNATSSSKIPVFYKDGNTYYTGDGNHRVAAEYINKKPTVRGLVLDTQDILKEGVGIITKQNQTADVGPNQTKIEAAKLGLTVDKGGVPPILKTNGKSKTPVSVMEAIEQLDELKMAPGYLQKEVNKIIQSTDPQIGLEFEVIIPRDEESNPDIEYTTTMDDIKEFFSETEEFEGLEGDYQFWLDDQQGEWVDAHVLDVLNNPSEEASRKITFMVDDYSTTDEVIDAIAEITGNVDDTELTTEIAEDVIARSDQIYKANGDADEWPQWHEGTDPYVIIYQDIFVDDKDQAEEYFKEDGLQEFYDYEYGVNDHKYSVGTYLRSMHINSMGDLFREYEVYLYWPGGPLAQDEFDEETAYQVADEISDLIGEDVSVEGGDSYGDVDTSQTWVVTSDVTIRPNTDGDAGMEIITRKMDYESGIDQINQVIYYLNSKGAYTNDSTGLHINVSLGNVDQSKLNYAKLIIMLGDAHILKQYGREFNEYTENSLTRLSAMMDATQGYTRGRKQTAKSYADMMGKMRNDFNNAVESSFASIGFGKFASVGLHDNRIEFRSVGGEGYLDDFDEIVALINRFIVAYAVATDPNAYKKEYGKKLYKLASNVGQGIAPTSSMQLFAKFNAGMITKEQLINQLKAKKDEKAEKAKKAEVDTGEATVPTQRHDAIQIVADKYGLDDNTAEIKFLEAEEKERDQGVPPGKMYQNVFNNLMKDIGYYEK